MSKRKGEYIGRNKPQDLAHLESNEECKISSVERKNSSTSFEYNSNNSQVHDSCQQDMNELYHVETERETLRREEDKKTENPTEQHLGNPESNDYEKKLDKCPPDFKRAKTHGFANKVKQPDFTEEKQDPMDDTSALCECCGRPTHHLVKGLPICVDTRELDVLGSGFPLYYHFKKFTIIIYLLMALFVGTPGLIINLNQEGRKEWDPTSSYIVSTTIGNNGNESDNYTEWRVQIQVILNFLFIFVISIASIFLRESQNTIIREVDEQNITPSDFGVMISNIPKDKRPDELRKWLEAKVPEIEIMYVNYCYDITELVKVTRKLTSMLQVKAYLEAYKKRRLQEEGDISEEDAINRGFQLSPPASKFCICIKKPYPSMDELNMKIKETERKQEKIMASMERICDSHEFCGTAFVVVNKQSHSERIAEYFESTLLMRGLTWIIYNVFQLKNSNINNRDWDGNLIYAERAAEPGDIYWENLAVSPRTRFKKILWTSFIALVCLGIAFGVNLGIRGIKKSIDGSHKESLTEEYFIRGLSITVSFLIAGINIFLGRVIRMLTSYEHHETYTKYHLSVAFKLTIAMFINTGVNPLFVNFGRANWFDSGGLMVDVFYIVITISLVSPFSYLFDPAYLVKLCKRWREERKGEKSKLTQRQANELFEGPPLDMAQRYSNTMLLFCMAVFYVFPMPIISVISLLGALFQYWLEKYLLLKRHKVPEPFGETMAQIFSNMIPFFCLLYGTSLYIFSTVLSEGKGWIGLAAFVLTLLYMILPFRQILNYLKKDIHRNDNYEYKEERIEFLTDYGRSNPITSKAANIYHQRLCDAMTTKVNTKPKVNEDEHSLEGVLNYGRQATSLEGKVFNNFQHFEMLVGPLSKDYLLQRKRTQHYRDFEIDSDNQSPINKRDKLSNGRRTSFNRSHTTFHPTPKSFGAQNLIANNQNESLSHNVSQSEEDT
ncbi:unnamed protein product [Moneuplotes crassus]|uniref:CSC1/OSCA1-like cytosolic domain-containing protein n=1 Tax=Euplotes crassus TaxID=5936 RepID=A0AAD2D421_EUPCR|nr:unnamed protein product [Moneuplotes crassus]